MIPSEEEDKPSNILGVFSGGSDISSPAPAARGLVAGAAAQAAREVGAAAGAGGAGAGAAAVGGAAAAAAGAANEGDTFEVELPASSLLVPTEPLVSTRRSSGCSSVQWQLLQSEEEGEKVEEEEGRCCVISPHLPHSARSEWTFWRRAYWCPPSPW